MEYFYARLFAASPAIRALFPASMTAQRERMLAMLGKIVSLLDHPSDCARLLAELARAHRRYGVLDKHYGSFFAALGDAARQFGGAAWTEQTASAWRAAADWMTATMRTAAAAETSPPWWTGEIVSHELRAPGVAVLRLRTEEPLPYQAGQYVPVQVTRWPHTWRPYSIASAPRPGGLLELHVKAVPGGLVSNTLVYHSDVGDCVLLGAAAGAMTLADSGRDLLCVAGGTGLAPIKALIEQSLASPQRSQPRSIRLLVGARQHFDLYDIEDLELIEAACPQLRVIPVLSQEPGYSGLTGLLPEVVAAHDRADGADVYVCGPAEMVRQVISVLAHIPADRLHHDPLIWPEPL